MSIPIPLKDSQIRGWYGEWLAYEHLRKKKFEILQRNWTSPKDRRREIDLILKDQACLVFVEVRARSRGAINSGYHSITSKKRKALLCACKDFLKVTDERFQTYRFDVIEVDLGDSEVEVFHHENVSLFPK